MADHSGHRKRMRERFLRHGLDNFKDHEILELLLFYAQPRMDMNETAHALLETFGSLDAVFEATPEALMTVPGIGESAAALIRLIPAAARRYRMAKEERGVILATSEEAGRYLIPRFMNCREETVYLVCLDAKLKVLDCRQVGSGSTVSVPFRLRKIVEVALMHNATAVILAHNHTSGIALPSKEDEITTLRVRDVLAEVGVVLYDHIIVAGEDFVSLSDDGLLDA